MKKEDKHNVLTIMAKLQPVAFMLSMSLVLAAFIANRQDSSKFVDLTNALMASVFFLFAYFGFFLSQKLDYTWFHSLGEISLLGGGLYIYKAFPGIITIIDEATNSTNTLFIYSLLFSFVLILVAYLLKNTEKERVIYKFCKTFWSISIILVISYAVLFLLKLQFTLPLSILRGSISLSLFPLLVDNLLKTIEVKEESAL